VIYGATLLNKGFLMPLTNLGDQDLIQYLLSGTTFTLPPTWYIGLSITAPTQFPGTAAPYWNFTEPVIGTGGYARIAETNNTTNFIVTGSEPSATAGTGFTIQNGTAFSFPASTAAWSTGATACGYFGLMDTSATVLNNSSSHLILFGTCSPTVTVNQTGVTVSFASGGLTAEIN
jgi:hypothetical protein